MTDRYAVAYIRRSSADADSPGDVSRAVQEATVRALATKDGFDDVVMYVDWAKSADEEKSEARTAYASMLTKIEAGEICCVYAYALDRLNRSLVMTARFAKACEKADVKIVTHREGEVRQDTPAEWLRWTILATFGEYELRTIKTRAASSLNERRKRGDKLGQAPYGYRLERVDGRMDWVRDPGQPIEPLVAAYRDAGSVLGACRLLKERGIPAPKGGEDWATSALTRILEREAPELLPTKSPTGRRTPSSAVFAQLLRCPFCGRMLTPNAARGQYYCPNGPRDRDAHPRYAVREADVLPWIQAEAARFIGPEDRVLEGDGMEARGAAIEERLERAREDYYSGRDKNRDRARATWEAEQKRAETDLDALKARTAVTALPSAIKWTWQPEVINGVLRALWTHVELGPDLIPVRANWVEPELRA